MTSTTEASAAETSATETSATETSADEATSSRGRPRDDERTNAILEATHTVLHAKGWADFRMDDVAKEAGCGLATIYRRWSTKEEVAAASMRHRFLPEIEETGDAETDLRSLTVALANEVIGMGGNCLGLMAATQTNELMQAAMEEGLMTVARPKFGGYLRELLGEKSPHVELLIDALAGSLMVRIALLGDTRPAETLADEFMALVNALR